jgi:hypothetical protein
MVLRIETPRAIVAHQATRALPGPVVNLCCGFFAWHRAFFLVGMPLSLSKADTRLLFVDKALSMSTAIIEAKLGGVPTTGCDSEAVGRGALFGIGCLRRIPVHGQFSGVQCFVPLTKGAFGRDSHGTRGEQMIRLL